MAGGDERLQLVIDLAQSEIADQFAGGVGVDGQAIGILLFDSALAGTILATAGIHPSPFNDSWGYPLGGLVVSALVAFTAASLGGMKAGPKLSEFNAKIQQLHGETATADAQQAAVRSLLETIEINRVIVQKKEGRLGLAIVLLALTFLGSGLYAGRDLLGKFLSGAGALLNAVMSSHGQLAGLVLVACLAILMVWIYAREG